MWTKKLWFLIVGCVLILLLLTAALAGGIVLEKNQYTLQIKLNDEREIKHEYGQEYQDFGATAQFYGTLLQKEPVDVPVTVESDVESQSLGRYLVKYTAKYEEYIGTAYRMVQVVDTQAPVIQLVSDPEKFTFPNETYVEEGFSAADNYDGDVTAQIQRTETREKITYTVADASGNVATVERIIKYDDPVPPVVQIKGDKSMTLMVGQAYTEPGYTAQDNCDGDLTGNVQVVGWVDTLKPGQYKLTYKVKDTYGNEATATRTVQVLEFSADVLEQYKTEIVPNGKTIYLTFDDGPGPRTPELLDVLKKYNVKATFFVVNTKYIDTIKRAAEEGHTVAIHTATHNFKSIYASEEAYFNDLYTMQGIIQNITGQTATILRFPGGSSNSVSKFNKGIMTRLVQAVTEKGFTYFDWNVDSKDAGGAKTADEVFNNVVNGIGNKQNAVVLQHDIKGYSIEAVEKIILWGLLNGYKFEALTPNSPECHHNVRN